MGDRVALANYRTKLDAEVAAGLLDNEGIAYLIQSAEGMLHGPIGPGATLYVSAGQADRAREVLGLAAESGSGDPPEAA